MLPEKGAFYIIVYINIDFLIGLNFIHLISVEQNSHKTQRMFPKFNKNIYRFKYVYIQSLNKLKIPCISLIRISIYLARLTFIMNYSNLCV